MLPRNAANQASVGGFLPLPCSAVPVLPETGVPGRFAPVPVPDVTTARIACCNPLATAAGRGWLTGAGPGVRWGSFHVPESAAAAMAAMDRGLVSTVPWPIADAAYAVPAALAGYEHPKEGTGSGAWPMLQPSSLAAAASVPVGRLSARLTNDVLQDTAKACFKGMVP